jgi:4-amino-4-deoxy-L-arabinose transferase-like glycosyltransferase
MMWSKDKIVWLLPLVIYLALLGHAPLLDTDEGRYAEIAQYMVKSGDWLVPHLNQVVYFEKPPLFYWFTAFSFLVFGQNEFAARLVSVVFAFLTLLLTYRLAYSLAGEKLARYSGMVFAVLLFNFVVGRLVSLDMTVAFFIAWAICEFYWYMHTRLRRHIYLGYLACGLAMMAKGLIGVVLPVGVIGLYALLTQRWRMLWRLISPVGILLFVSVTLPWYGFMTMRFPGEGGYFGPGGYFDFFIMRHHFYRFTSGMSHQEGVFYFFGVVLVGMLPYLLFLPRWLYDLRHTGWPFWRERRDSVLFLLAWFGLIFVFFSISQSKLMPYVSPLFPPLAVLLASVVAAWLKLPPQENRWFSLWESLVFFVAWLSLFLIPLLVTMLIDRRGWLLGTVLLSLPLLALVLLPWRTHLGKERQVRALSVLFATLLAFSPLLISSFAASYKSGRNIALALQKHYKPQDVIVHFEGYVNSLAFYAGKYCNERPIVVDYPREHRFGVQRLPLEEQKTYCPEVSEFAARWPGETRRLLCVYRARELRKSNGQEQVRQELGTVLGKVYFLEWCGEYVLFSNREP